MERTKIRVGDKVRDTVTGFSGIVVAMTEWLNGCLRATVQPQELHDGKPIDPFTFDVEQLEVIAPEAAKALAPSGGPTAEPRRPDTPGRS